MQQNGYKPPMQGVHLGAQQAMTAGVGGLHHPVRAHQSQAGPAPGVLNQMIQAHPMPHPAFNANPGIPAGWSPQAMMNAHAAVPAMVHPLPMPAPVVKHPVGPGVPAGVGMQVQHAQIPIRAGVSGVGAPGANVIAAMMLARGGQR